MIQIQNNNNNVKLNNNIINPFYICYKQYLPFSNNIVNIYSKNNTKFNNTNEVVLNNNSSYIKNITFKINLFSLVTKFKNDYNEDLLNLIYKNNLYKYYNNNNNNNNLFILDLLKNNEYTYYLFYDNTTQYIYLYNTLLDYSNNILNNNNDILLRNEEKLYINKDDIANINLLFNNILLNKTELKNTLYEKLKNNRNLFSITDNTNIKFVNNIDKSNLSHGLLLYNMPINNFINLIFTDKYYLKIVNNDIVLDYILDYIDNVLKVDINYNFKFYKYINYIKPLNNISTNKILLNNKILINNDIISNNIIITNTNDYTTNDIIFIRNNNKLNNNILLFLIKKSNNNYNIIESKFDFTSLTTTNYDLIFYPNYNNIYNYTYHITLRNQFSYEYEICIYKSELDNEYLKKNFVNIYNSLNKLKFLFFKNKSTLLFDFVFNINKIILNENYILIYSSYFNNKYIGEIDKNNYISNSISSDLKLYNNGIDKKLNLYDKTIIKIINGTDYSIILFLDLYDNKKKIYYYNNTTNFDSVSSITNYLLDKDGGTTTIINSASDYQLFYYTTDITDIKHNSKYFVLLNNKSIINIYCDKNSDGSVFYTNIGDIDTGFGYIKSTPFINLYCGYDFIVLNDLDNNIIITKNIDDGTYTSSQTVALSDIIINLVCGINFIIILFKNKLYGIGNDVLNNKLKLTLTVDTLPLYEITTTLFNINDISKISSNQDNIIILTKNNKIYGAGSNTNYKLGLSNSGIYYTITEIPLNKINNKVITDIYCGSNYSIFITNNNELYGTGTNSNNQLNSTGVDILYFTYLDKLDNLIYFTANVNTMYITSIINGVIIKDIIKDKNDSLITYEYIKDMNISNNYKEFIINSIQNTIIFNNILIYNIIKNICTSTIYTSIKINYDSDADTAPDYNFHIQQKTYTTINNYDAFINKFFDISEFEPFLYIQNTKNNYKYFNKKIISNNINYASIPYIDIINTKLSEYNNNIKKIKGNINKIYEFNNPQIYTIIKNLYYFNNLTEFFIDITLDIGVDISTDDIYIGDAGLSSDADIEALIQLIYIAQKSDHTIYQFKFTLSSYTTGLSNIDLFNTIYHGTSGSYSSITITNINSSNLLLEHHNTQVEASFDTASMNTNYFINYYLIVYLIYLYDIIKDFATYDSSGTYVFNSSLTYTDTSVHTSGVNITNATFDGSGVPTVYLTGNSAFNIQLNKLLIKIYLSLYYYIKNDADSISTSPGTNYINIHNIINNKFLPIKESIITELKTHLFSTDTYKADILDVLNNKIIPVNDSNNPIINGIEKDSKTITFDKSNHISTTISDLFNYFHSYLNYVLLDNSSYDIKIILDIFNSNHNDYFDLIENITDIRYNVGYDSYNFINDNTLLTDINNIKLEHSDKILLISSSSYTTAITDIITAKLVTLKNKITTNINNYNNFLNNNYLLDLKTNDYGSTYTDLNTMITNFFNLKPYNNSNLYTNIDTTYITAITAYISDYNSQTLKYETILDILNYDNIIKNYLLICYVTIINKSLFEYKNIDIFFKQNNLYNLVLKQTTISDIDYTTQNTNFLTYYNSLLAIHDTYTENNYKLNYINYNSLGTFKYTYISNNNFYNYINTNNTIVTTDSGIIGTDITKIDDYLFTDEIYFDNIHIDLDKLNFILAKYYYYQDASELYTIETFKQSILSSIYVNPLSVEADKYAKFSEDTNIYKIINELAGTHYFYKNCVLTSDEYTEISTMITNPYYLILGKDNIGKTGNLVVNANDEFFITSITKNKNTIFDNLNGVLVSLVSNNGEGAYGFYDNTDIANIKIILLDYGMNYCENDVVRIEFYMESLFFHKDILEWYNSSFNSKKSINKYNNKTSSINVYWRLNYNYYNNVTAHYPNNFMNNIEYIDKSFKYLRRKSDLPFTLKIDTISDAKYNYQIKRRLNNKTYMILKLWINKLKNYIYSKNITQQFITNIIDTVTSHGITNIIVSDGDNKNSKITFDIPIDYKDIFYIYINTGDYQGLYLLENKVYTNIVGYVVSIEAYIDKSYSAITILSTQIDTAISTIITNYKEYINYIHIDPVIFTNSILKFNLLNIDNFFDKFNLQHFNIENFSLKIYNYINNNNNDFNKNIILSNSDNTILLNYYDSEKRMIYSKNKIIEGKLNDNNYYHQIKNNSSNYNNYIKDISLISKNYKANTICESAWVKNICLNIFEYIKLYIDDKCIYNITNNYLNINNQLLNNDTRIDRLNNIYGNTADMITINKLAKKSKILLLNIPFWFSNTPNLIPISLLNNNKVKIKYKLKNIKSLIKFNNINDFNNIIINNIEKINISAIVNYIDIPIKNLNNISNLYLLEEIQEIKTNKLNNYTINNNILELKITLKKIIKEFYMIVIDENNEFINCIEYFEIYNGDKTIFKSNNNNINLYKYRYNNANIYVHNINLNSMYPSGGCNFSIFNNKKIKIHLKTYNTNYKIIIYAKNYNLLQIINKKGNILF